MQRSAFYVLILGLITMTCPPSANAQAIQHPFQCVKVSTSYNNVIINAESGQEVTTYPSSPNTGVPFQPFGYDVEGNRQTYRISSSDGRYSAELISPDQAFMRGDYLTPLNNRLLVRDTFTNHFHLFPEQQIAAFYWSPDGKQLAYLHGNDEQFDLVIVNPDGTDSSSIKLPFPLTGIYEVIWSADGKYMAFMSQASKQFSFLSVNDMRFVLSEPLLTAPPYYEGGWSPQGHDFAYWNWTPDFKTVLLSIISLPDGTVKQRIAVPPDSFLPKADIPGTLHWSPDGNYIASVYTAPVYGDDVFVLDLYDSVDSRQWHGKDTAVSWSYPGDLPYFEGNAIVAGQNQIDPGTGDNSYFNLVSFLINTHTVKTIAKNIVLAAHSPQSGRIAYATVHDVNNGAGLTDIVEVNADGTQPTTLMQNANIIDNVSWSPDGQYVVAGGIFTSDNSSDPIYDINDDPDAYGVEFPVDFARDTQLAWSRADGTQIHDLHYQMVHVLQWLPGKPHDLMYIVEQNNSFAVMMLDTQTGQSHPLLSGLNEDSYRFTNNHDFVNEWNAFPLSDGKHLILRYGWSRPAYGQRFWSQGVYLTTWSGQDTRELIPAPTEATYNNFAMSDVIPSPDGSAAVISLPDWEGTLALLILGHEGQSTIFSLDLADNLNSLSFAWTDCSI